MSPPDSNIQVSASCSLELLEIYGPCISTASWSEWPRRRKVLATPFNENIMAFVWNESLGQAQGMLELWTNQTKAVSKSFAKDTRSLSLNVLAATGFRRSYSFQAATSNDGQRSEAQGYRDALQTVLDNAIILMLIPYRYLTLPLLPKSWSRLGKATIDFKEYMAEMLDKETSLIRHGDKGTGSLMTSFVRALDTQLKDSVPDQGKEHASTRGLSVDEIFGNIFVINFAGHDTTANTLAFAMLLLLVYPEVQDWVGDELRGVLGGLETRELTYSVYPKLKRCQAVLVSCDTETTGAGPYNVNSTRL